MALNALACIAYDAIIFKKTTSTLIHRPEAVAAAVQKNAITCAPFFLQQRTCIPHSKKSTNQARVFFSDGRRKPFAISQDLRQERKNKQAK